ncbi:TonB-dependent receptor plug domain-containing protein [Flavobacterium sp.]|uniref:TonB-dependent receptor plug domain-containing protein n=1 Tax=Flavobacterium sp. TaxID=239 RepID=UPI0012183476|nr:TonB-dependent receptor plug domain-containing protein [Flavobacterium sp.]RZJ73468.1 MAG: TonB-dependent receptor [Flavobacterium sp.]
MRLYLTALLSFTALVGFAQDTLQTISVQSNTRSIKKSLTVTANTQVMTSKELLKAACCNLAESFETNPSIDVNFSDALTGAKQVKMLGLTSPYLMITEENIPSVRGASQAYGLTFTPGTWVESIQITKGAGSVVNGFESISGQINTELLKPMNDIPFFLNFYGSTDSRFELNAHLNRKLSDKWASSLFIHGNSRLTKNDMNNDGFLDNPLGHQINMMNRWQYSNPEKGWVSFINLRFMDDAKQSGEVDFIPSLDKLTTNHWGSEINTRRYDLATKIGYVWPEMPFQSIGFQNAINRHEQDSYFGLVEYDIAQTSYYSNLIFNSIIDNTMHKFSTGLNFTYDKYDEKLWSIDFSRIDNALGAFFEYTYDNADNFSLIAGIRADNSNRLGTFLTPRLHARYNPWKDAVIRASAGRGKRLANIFAENQQIFASSRSFGWYLDNDSGFYGLKPEIAWNYGVSFNQKFHIFGQPADAGFDLYRTDFQNQAVADFYSAGNLADFYDLKGKSYVNSVQVDFNYEPYKHLNLRTAYKYYDSRTDYATGSFERPLTPRHRFFANAEFATHIKEKGQRWKFDATWNWTGTQRLPATASGALPDYSPAFSVLNAQITRTFSSAFEVYVGGENMANYRQKNPILGADDPFGPNFDASVLYAPVFGQMYYAGFRFKIK